MLSREGETFSSVSFFLKGRSQPRDRRAGLENLCLQHSLTHSPRAVWPKEGQVWNLAVLRAADVGWGHVLESTRPRCLRTMPLPSRLICCTRNLKLTSVYGLTPEPVPRELLAR